MLTYSAFRFELDPNNAQAGLLSGHCRAAKIARNWMLAKVKADIDAHQLDPAHVSVGWSAPSLRRAWNAAKAEIYPGWARYSKETYSSAATQVALALDNWDQSHKGERKGRKIGFPRFKQRVDSYTVTTGVFGIRDRRHIRVPIIGVIRTKESTIKLLRLLDGGRARILKVAVSTKAGRWFVSFACEVERPEHKPSQPWTTIGVDAGITRLATIVDTSGEIVDRVENPRPLQKKLGKLRRYQRTLSRRVGPDKRTGQRPSKRYRKQQAKVARLHQRVASDRSDSCHKLTTSLVKTNGTVVVEKLNVAGMMIRNRRQGRLVADSGMGKIRPQCAYKARWYGSICVEASQWYPSSKLCSDCGAKNDRLKLSDRTWTCARCGVRHDRDENAGLNLARYLQQGTASAAGTSLSGENARGEDVRPRPARRPSWKREARAATAGKASSVPTQDGTRWWRCL